MPLRRTDHLAFLALTSRRKRIHTALVLLRDACDGAGDLHLAPQEFALEVGQLRAAGLTNTDLRWLIGKGYVEHLHELPAGANQARAFRKESSLSITPASCFVLTEEGHSALSGWAESSSGRSCRPGEGERSGSAPRSSHPRWDAEQRELWWGAALVKRFRVPAVNQEVILSAFEEEGWPPRVDDPLPRTGETDPKVRLHDAIKGLNRNQVQARVRFRGDGTGRSILWAQR